MTVSRNYQYKFDIQLISLDCEKKEKFISQIAFYFSYDRDVEILKNGIIHIIS